MIYEEVTSGIIDVEPNHGYIINYHPSGIEFNMPSGIDYMYSAWFITKGVGHFIVHTPEDHNIAYGYSTPGYLEEPERCNTIESKGNESSMSLIFTPSDNTYTVGFVTRGGIEIY